MSNQFKDLRNIMEHEGKAINSKALEWEEPPGRIRGWRELDRERGLLGLDVGHDKTESCESRF